MLEIGMYATAQLNSYEILKEALSFFLSFMGSLSALGRAWVAQ